MFSKLFDLVRPSRRPRRPGPPVATAHRPGHGRPRLEELEPRLAPTANFQIDLGGILRADCDNTANTVRLDHSGSQTILSDTGHSVPFDDYRFTSIRIQGGTAADTFNLYATVRPVTLLR